MIDDSCINNNVQVKTFNDFLKSYAINAKCVHLSNEGCVDTFYVQILDGFRINKLTSLSKELMLMLKAQMVPIFNIIPGSQLIKIEVIGEKIATSSLCTSFVHNEYFGFDNLTLKIGNSFKNTPLFFDLDKNPHMLIGGSTGSGKSSLLHNIITNLLLRTAADIYIIDTKGVEFQHYLNLGKRVCLANSYKDFIKILEYLIHIMELRFDLLKNNPDINPINNSYFSPITLIIDEFADLIMYDEHSKAEKLLCRLAQKCRAASIFCILATQRPSADIITGLIKANFPARIACKTASKIDSRIILDRNGAENLGNIGEAIINNYKYEFERFKIYYSPISEIKKILNEKLASTS